MPEQFHISPDGVKYRLIATRRTTPTNDTEAKEIRVATETIEVIVSDSRLLSLGSNFGHVAIAIDDIAYSRAPDGYESKRSPSRYLVDQQAFRDSVGYVLRVSPAEKAAIQTELSHRVMRTLLEPDKHPYSLMDDSCSSNAADIWKMAGIFADSRGFGPISPSDLITGMMHSKRIKETRSYPKRRQ